MPFLGLDHVDVRVRSLSLVEPFYDALMPLLDLSEKRYASVDPSGEWRREFDDYNVAEYYEPDEAGHVSRFVGFIEDPLHRNNDTRIAFRVAPERLAEFEAVLRRIGAEQVETSRDPAYPAVFFEDPGGTKLELVARLPH